MTTKLEVILAGVLALVLCCAGVGIWYHFHNASERKEGAAACVQATTETRTAAVDSNTDDTKAQRDELAGKVSTYETQLADLQRNNSDLAQRVRANQVRGGAVLGAGSAAHEDLCPVELPAGQSQLKQVLDDCDANFERADFAVSEYAKVRQRIIDENAKRAVKPIPAH